MLKLLVKENKMSLLKAMKSFREVLKLTVFRRFPKVSKAPIPKENYHHGQNKHTSLVPFSFKNDFLKSIFSRAITFMRPSFTRSGRGGINKFRHVPFLSLVGVSLGVDMNSLSDGYMESTMTALRDVFKDYKWEPEQLDHSPTSLDDLELNKQSVIGRGCEGAVFEARLRTGLVTSTASASSVETKEGKVDYNLAVKAVFNYGIESNASSILRELNREVVPLHSAKESSSETRELISSSVTRLPPHPNVVDMHCVFVDDMLVTEQGKNEFPAAMPRRINPEGYFGRNKTLYLVMKRCTSCLSDYLSNDLSMSTRCLLLTQLFEAVSHINSNGVAHRDIKMDNILIDIAQTNDPPRLQICDFGCCLAEESKSLVMPFVSSDVNIGGNSWLMAPEISSARPGNGAALDFRKSDLWACGALAYAILGADIPFYPNNNKQLVSKSYTEEELPPLPDNVPLSIKQLIKSILSRNPEKRPSASVAALVCLMTSWELGEKHKSTSRLVHPVIVTKCKKVSIYINYRNKQKQKMEMLLGKTFDLIKKMGADSSQPKQDIVEILNFLRLSKMTLTEFHSALKFF